MRHNATEAKSCQPDEMEDDIFRFVKESEKYAWYIKETGSTILTADQIQSLHKSKYKNDYPLLFCKGDISYVSDNALKAVAVVGTRSPSEEGTKRTRKIVRDLVNAGYIVMSGLAKGIDTEVHRTTLEIGGKTIAILGTPIGKIYPAQNKALAENIVRDGLLTSATRPGEHGKYIFPKRNRLMALLSVATIVVEAGETSGVIHQASECVRLGKKLIFLKSLCEKNYEWVHSFLHPKKGSPAHILESSEQLSPLLSNL